jgi:nitroreductase/FMN reductase [NAD(P)H]
MADHAKIITDALAQRFGESFSVDPALSGIEALARIAGHGVCRKYQNRAITPELLRLLCACALSAPTKSDLQQADIMIVADAGKRRAIEAKLPDMPWMADAPVFLIFLANGRRLPQMFALRERPFPNDHLDAFFNATVDAALVLATFNAAAEAVGLGCCPISLIRDHATFVSELLELPERVVPVAGLCVGWPAEGAWISPRLPLATTVHQDRYQEGNPAAAFDAYDKRRHGVRAYRRQRDPKRFGEAAFYGWSEDKARQYAVPQRADFGAFVRAKGFKLD